MANSNLSSWGGIWKSIKRIDRDQNGFVTAVELESIFKEYFPLELDKKTIYNFLKRYRSVNNKTLINYKLIKDEINKIIMKRQRNEESRTREETKLPS